MSSAGADIANPFGLVQFIDDDSRLHLLWTEYTPGYADGRQVAQIKHYIELEGQAANESVEVIRNDTLPLFDLKLYDKDAQKGNSIVCFRQI